MVRFLIQVLLSFAFWAFVIWFGLPIVKEKTPSVYGGLASLLTDDTLSSRISDAVDTVEHNVKTIAKNPPQVELPQVKIEMPSILVLERKQTEEQKSDTPQQDYLTTQVEGIPVVMDAEEVPKDTMAALNKDPGYKWGIVVTNSFFYDSTMKRAGILAGGTVVARKQSQMQMNGYVAECFYLIDRTWQYDTIYLYESDLVLFDCTYQEANKDQRNLLLEYCSTKGKLEELRALAYKTAIRRNPYFEQYKTVTDEYKAFVQKARQAKEDFDNASDVKRSILLDQLRKYQAEEITIKQRYSAIKGQYDAWKTENIGEDKTPKITKTVEIQNLENKLNALRPVVQEIVPGL